MDTNDKTKWINTVLTQLRNTSSPQTITAIENCGRECLKSSGDFETVKKLREEIPDTEDMDLLFDAYKEKVYDSSPRLYKKDGDIYLKYHECSCGMVTRGGVTDPFLCHCTVGYTKQIFESWFKRPVQVTLLKSILKGDDICLQRLSFKMT